MDRSEAALCQKIALLDRQCTHPAVNRVCPLFFKLFLCVVLCVCYGASSHPKAHRHLHAKLVSLSQEALGVQTCSSASVREPF